MIRIMTQNIRFPNPTDEGNLWQDRRDLAAEVIREEAPDVIGMQEMYREQIAFFARALPEYAVIAWDRRTDRVDEHNPLLIRHDRFMVRECGTFWLSSTPDIPGSRDWTPDDHPRIGTWAVLDEFENDCPFLVVNTHFQLGAEEIRERSAGVIAEQMAQFDMPAVLTGDFNSTPDGLAYAKLIESGLDDSFEAADTDAQPVGTFHGFTGEPRSGRIDWILTRGFIAKDCRVITTNRDGKYPADHFAVVADMKMVDRDSR
jgi:endonuclease/exonuclease/phosphatase family metal-dependent hydrolase